jgi:hypothetical protein
LAGQKRLGENSNSACLAAAAWLQPLAQEKLFRSFIRSLYRQPWVVHTKAPFGGPQHMLHYLARYIHRRSDLQPSTGELRQWRSNLPPEGLRAWQQETLDDSQRR